MKKVLALTVVLVIVVVIVIPAVVLYGLGGPAGTRSTGIRKGEDIPIRVYLHDQDRIVEMSLEEYVKGMVAAEMPAEFELEALKAQAVAGRTYAVKQMALFGGGGLANRPGADVSTNPAESQAWMSTLQLRDRWGPFAFDRYWAKIGRAVEETRGLIATYNSEPINAVFHSTSGERTASAQEVWGFDYPYLRSVVCTWDKKSPRYSDSREYSLVELEQRLGSDAGVVAAAQGGGGSVAQIIDRTESGRVSKARVGSKTFSGLDLRKKLELRSANFTMESKDGKVVFKTTGYGHGVGMCQYGANGMAKEGRSFRDILTYYYTGVKIASIHES
ncbi:stage II sporulation protein D [Anaeroselena agilis]|uniref:Stage II sporulation protein D n=1 Tax=Anaeroselena agilis TaxID=3063788 RepID=A0ABU3P410_9FIRM|nr:stage II sporulation protein D [Selenomonadales bacterium 4137-cl]